MFEEDLEPIREGDIVLVPARVEYVADGQPLRVETLDGEHSFRTDCASLHGFQRRIFAVGDRVYDEDGETSGDVVLVSPDYVLVQFAGQILPVVYPVDGNRTLFRTALAKKSPGPVAA